jgi:hypothetical protein
MRTSGAAGVEFVIGWRASDLLRRVAGRARAASALPAVEVRRLIDIPEQRQFGPSYALTAQFLSRWPPLYSERSTGCRRRRRQARESPTRT